MLQQILAGWRAFTFRRNIWSESLLPGSPSGVNKAVLSEYMTTNSEAIVMGRSDWEYMSDIHISGYKTGMRITTRVNSLEAANAQLFQFILKNVMWH